MMVSYYSLYCLEQDLRDLAKDIREQADKPRVMLMTNPPKDALCVRVASELDEFATRIGELMSD